MSQPSDIRTFPRRPIVGVGAVVWRDDAVLLIRRGNPPKAGQWSLPGGAQELGETVQQAVIREVREEAGIDITDLILIDVVDMITPPRNGKVEYHYTLIDFTARALAGDLQAGGDASDARWVNPIDLPHYDLWDKTLEIIEKSRSILAQK
ncbi:MAG: NUDIX hydrolase [Pseudomonadota bacterium]